MLAMIRSTRLAIGCRLARPFAKKTQVKTFKTVEIDEYDFPTAIRLLKASAVRSLDESIDVLIKYGFYLAIMAAGCASG